jgi:hypothetical protein
VIILVACLMLLVLTVLAPRSDIRRLAHLHVRHTWLVWAALAVQVLVISILPGRHHTLSAMAHLGSYALAGVFVFVNSRLPGAAVVAVGGSSNLLAITANGGTMPASPGALARSGWHAAPGHFANSAAVEHPRLGFLGDIFAVPAWFPVHSVFSVGDVIIVAGVAVFLHRGTTRDRPRPTPYRHQGTQVTPQTLGRAHEPPAPGSPAQM